jgi:hypothetical protein
MGKGDGVIDGRDRKNERDEDGYDLNCFLLPLLINFF